MIALEERFKRSLPVKFTVDELRGKADELADKVARREGLEEEKKRVGADYKARIDATTSDINLLARHITERCEYQQVECQAYLDHPDYGKKTIYRCDTGDMVGIETMQPADRQTVIQWEKESKSHNATPATDEQPATPEMTEDVLPFSEDEETAFLHTPEPLLDEEPEHDTAGRENEHQDFEGVLSGEVE